LAWLVCLAIGVALSTGYGMLIAPGLAHREPVVKAVATLGFGIAILGAMNLLWVVNPRKLTLALDGVSFNLFGLRMTGTRVVALAAGIAVTAGMGIFRPARRRHRPAVWRSGPA